MRYLDLEKHLSAVSQGFESAKPLYVVAGNDAYLCYNALGAFKSLVEDDFKDFNLTFVSQSEGIGAVEDALSTFPMFGDRKVVVVPDISSRLSDQEKDFVRTYVLSPNPTSILVAVIDDAAVNKDDDSKGEKGSDAKADKSDDGDGQKGKKGKDKLPSLAKTFCAKYGIEFVDCNHLEREEIANEVGALLNEAPVRRMDRTALNTLIDFTQSDMSRIAKEVQKLKAYSDDVITVGDVEALVAPDFDYAGFMLTSAVCEKQADKAVDILNALYGRGMKGLAIISMLYNQYRKMLHATLFQGDDKQLGEFLEVSSGQLYHVKRVAKTYSQVRLKKCVDYLHETYYAVISGRRNEESAVHDVILTLLNA